MLACLDTNIYLNVLKGKFSQELYASFYQQYIVRLSPVVYHELIRFVRYSKIKDRINAMTRSIIFMSAPNKKVWIKAAELASKVVGSHDDRSLSQIQNDLLIALSAREQGMMVITQDKHFQKINQFVSFSLRMI